VHEVGIETETDQGVLQIEATTSRPIIDSRQVPAFLTGHREETFGRTCSLELVGFGKPAARGEVVGTAKQKARVVEVTGPKCSSAEAIGAVPRSERSDAVPTRQRIQGDGGFRELEMQSSEVVETQLEAAQDRPGIEGLDRVVGGVDRDEA
jgi:hypothetical protein